MKDKISKFQTNQDRLDVALQHLNKDYNEKKYKDSQIEKKEHMKLGQILLNEKRERKWMYQRGKQGMLDFLDEEIKKLKQTFDQLDEDGGGSISVEELENPLIGLGLADTREEIQQMIDEVDEDGSG